MRYHARLAVIMALGLTLVILKLAGRRWWCKLGDLAVWSRGIHSTHTSQHLADAYSFTHMLHGILFYGGLRLTAGKLSREARFALAVGLECLWEVVENSPFVIDRYRRGTIALGYEGDSVFNSLGDILACAIGFLIAGRLPVRWSVALVFAVEISLLIIYRDNLLLNIIMLIHPLQALKSWQMGT